MFSLPNQGSPHLAAIKEVLFSQGRLPSAEPQQRRWPLTSFQRAERGPGRGDCGSPADEDLSATWDGSHHGFRVTRRGAALAPWAPLRPRPTGPGRAGGRFPRKTLPEEGMLRKARRGAGGL